jgi:hypothetical protein
MWNTNLCRPPWITPCLILGNGGFALAARRYQSIQLFQLQILKGILTLIQNQWSFRQTSNNESCSKSFILQLGVFLEYSHHCSYLF